MSILSCLSESCLITPFCQFSDEKVLNDRTPYNKMFTQRLDKGRCLSHRAIQSYEMSSGYPQNASETIFFISDIGHRHHHQLEHAHRGEHSWVIVLRLRS